ncbi:MAG: tRNA (uridine(34)/cytosine(34)/5-carboxymethylaminomethyluridine(34)-2'-O)-methyltransferase TrmL [Gammaproteobacteria bacterium]|nr:MAG: tRNA (uridine(34)/cytosine(34)/5-carboxymethylaminomethyluridine(34)-2'-O)-methyltransferase TrmL [Pseudomonadota bacterium]PIE38658.1 MAG: tRNA (uridine(34)/cytosine(34)/5-carboxymethylaminomethyluridine(34)-2'-O)-methyltransferase TrmL [Gammaproteobacteria bacterium]
MFNIVLYEPEIPPNTGNIIRLSANTGCHLHLIEPLGFALDEKKLKRAGLDYREFTQVKTHKNFTAFMESEQPERLFALTTKGTKTYSEAQFKPGDYLIFGPESRGLPQWLRDQAGTDHCLRLPMAPDSRSLNLSNTVAIMVYEAWRQNDFAME